MVVKEEFALEFTCIEEKNLLFFKKILKDLSINIVEEENRNNYFNLTCTSEDYSAFLFATHLYLERKELNRALDTLLM